MCATGTYVEDALEEGKEDEDPTPLCSASFAELCGAREEELRADETKDTGNGLWSSSPRTPSPCPPPCLSPVPLLPPLSLSASPPPLPSPSPSPSPFPFPFPSDPPPPSARTSAFPKPMFIMANNPKSPPIPEPPKRSPEIPRTTHWPSRSSRSQPMYGAKNSAPRSSAGRMARITPLQAHGKSPACALCATVGRPACARPERTPNARAARSAREPTVRAGERIGLLSCTHLSFMSNAQKLLLRARPVRFCAREPCHFFRATTRNQCLSQWIDRAHEKKAAGRARAPPAHKATR